MMAHAFKAHPFTVFIYLKRLLPLLIIPVASSVYRYILQGVTFSSTLWDVGAAALSVGWAMLECRKIAVVVKGDFVYFEKGLVFSSRWRIRRDRLTAVYTEKGVPYIFFGAVKVLVDSEAGDRKHSDFWFYVNQSEARHFVKVITDFEDKVPIKSSFWQSLLLSLSESSAWSGLILFASAINYLGRFLGKRLEVSVIGELTSRARDIGLLIPPITAAAAGLILLGFLVSFGLSVIKHAGHRGEFCDKIIHLSQGLLWRRDSYIFRDKIPSVVTVSSPVLHFFGRKNLRVNIGGYGNKQEGESVLPAIKKGLHFNRRAKRLSCVRGAKGRVVKIPLFLLCGILAVWVLLSVHIPSLAMLWGILGISGCAVCLYRIMIKLAEVKRGGVYGYGDIAVLHQKRLTFYEGIVAQPRVEALVIRQSPFDLKYGACTLTVMVESKKKSRFSAANLDIDESVGFCEEFSSFC